MDTARDTGRVALVTVTAVPDARVQLQRGEATTETTVPDGPDPLTSVARATVEGLTELVPAGVTFRLESVEQVTTSRPLVVAVVITDIAGVALPHVGSALVGDDEAVAAARAVLSAVNRRLEILGP